MRQILILLLLCPMVSSAQYQPLTIGSALPPMEFDSVVNFSNTTLCTADLKGKLVVLDFFATWCGSCRKNIPLLDSLQRKYKDRLQVVLVSSINTKDDITRIKAFYSRMAAMGHTLTMPAIVHDSVLMQLFPFTTIPHYVWLDENLTVKAITSSAFVTEENILKMLSLIKPSPNPNTR